MIVFKNYLKNQLLINFEACDVIAMSDMVSNRSGKTTKFMPSILMCPIYDADIAKKMSHLDMAFKELDLIRMDDQKETLFNGEEFKVAKKDWHYRFHPLEVVIDGKNVMEKALIDFKHYFTVPATYLMEHRKERLFHLDDLFAEQITLKFATFLSRVAIPDE